MKVSWINLSGVCPGGGEEEKDEEGVYEEGGHGRAGEGERRVRERGLVGPR